MSGGDVTVIVPVWNRRELLERLLCSLARADPRRRGSAGGGRWIAGWLGGSRRTLRRQDDPPGRAWRLCQSREPGNSREPHAPGGDRQQRCGTGAGLAGQSCLAGSTPKLGLRQAEFCRLAIRAASMPPTTRSAAEALRGALGTLVPTDRRFGNRARSDPRRLPRPCFAPNCSTKPGCSTSASNPIWKMWTSDCAARWPGARDDTCRTPSPGTQGSATLGRWHPETTRLIARNQVFLIAKHYPARMLLTQCLAHRGGAGVVGTGGSAVTGGAGRGCAARWRGCGGSANSARWGRRFRLPNIFSGTSWPKASGRFAACSGNPGAIFTGLCIFCSLQVGQSDTCVRRVSWL